MGNKGSKTKSSKTHDASGIQKQSTKQTRSILKKSDPVQYANINYTILPLAAKFDKIDLVEYGKCFDEWKIPQISDTVEFDLQRYISQHGDQWFKSSSVRGAIADLQWTETKQCQFPLKQLMWFCVNYNQCELLEFVCTQELMDCDKWERIYFKAIIFSSIAHASVSTKLNPLRVMASYCIPERMTEEEFKSVMRGGMYHDFCTEMVVEGMRGRATRIIGARKALIESCAQFPNELIALIVSLLFGLSSRSV